MFLSVTCVTVVQMKDCSCKFRLQVFVHFFQKDTVGAETTSDGRVHNVKNEVARNKSPTIVVCYP